jgi:predicted aldo/keto reductase-like oxidoreductase
MVPQQQAIDTLKHGFDLGVNFVHTAPDYDGAEDLVAQAVDESGRDILVFSQGYGELSHFEWLFEMACLRSKNKPLDVFGIACVEDRELLGENVWGKGGMIEFLLQKKSEGRLRSIFAETHGTPEYIAKLIKSNVFDAVLLAYNTMGFHALSYFPEPPGTFENIPRNKTEIFPLARQHQVSIMLMKSLGGGLMCAGKAFPPHARFSDEKEPLAAGEILRQLLLDQDITAVVPGTASVEEADENARAGFSDASISHNRLKVIEQSSAEMVQTLCSRCGYCDSICSQNLPVSWLFRDAYIQTIRAETFETLDRLQYFHLHPQLTAKCASCDHVTCLCPFGIDVPGSLIRVHEVMSKLKDQKLLALTPTQQEQQQMGSGPWGVKVISAEIPPSMRCGDRAVCRLWCENGSAKNWVPASHWTGGVGLYLLVQVGERDQTVVLRHVVEPGTRTHFIFEVEAPDQAGDCKIQLFLKTSGQNVPEEGGEISAYSIQIRC